MGSAEYVKALADVDAKLETGVLCFEQRLVTRDEAMNLWLAHVESRIGVLKPEVTAVLRAAAADGGYFVTPTRRTGDPEPEGSGWAWFRETMVGVLTPEAIDQIVKTRDVDVALEVMGKQLDIEKASVAMVQAQLRSRRTATGVPIEHTIRLIGGPRLWRWVCSCGANASGRWYRSETEALKRGDKHVKGRS